MSRTISRGLTDAGRWTSVATAVVEHLEALEQAAKRHSTAPAAPAGAIDAARRFFEYVLDGIALDQQRESLGPSPPTSSAMAVRSRPAMAGISNLSIAVNVMRSTGVSGSATDLEYIERQITSFVNVLDRLKTNGVKLRADADLKSLAMFMRELQRQGEIARDVTVARQERPRTYSGQML